MKKRPGVQVEFSWELGIAIRGQDAAGFGRDVDPEIIPSVTFPQAVSALTKAISAMQPHEASVFVSWEWYYLLRGGNMIKALRFADLGSG